MHHRILVIEGEEGRRPKLDISVHDTFDVRLTVQLGTGYRWELVTETAGVVSSTGEPKFESADQIKPGSRETQVFSFRADHVGSLEMLFQYVRPWEPMTPMKQIVLRVFVS